MNGKRSLSAVCFVAIMSFTPSSAEAQNCTFVCYDGRWNVNSYTCDTNAPAADCNYCDYVCLDPKNPG